MSSLEPHNISANSADACAIEALAQLCKASADQLRLEILRALSQDSFNVQELCQIFELKQSAISHHLKILAAADLVTTRREGNTLFYRRDLFNQQHHHALLQQALLDSIDQCPIRADITAGIKRVEQARTESSKDFFLQNANKFREQQDLIASFEQYADSVADFLKAIPLPAQHKAIEIGPGDGRFLSVLSPMFAHVSAYDNSSAMIAAAQEYITREQLDNTTLVLGDSSLATAQESLADCVVVNMVLHHIASPADIFNHSSQLLKTHGALIITDLCPHDQSWAKTSCGDLWLGFEPEDLSFWAKQAGLAEGKSSYLAQRNGFRIQIRHFYLTQPITTSPPLEETINE